MTPETDFPALVHLCATMDGYAPLAARTRSGHFQVFSGRLAAGLFNGLRRLFPGAARSADFVHAAFGLTGEVRELRDALRSGDRANALEECGDAYWYAALLYVHATNTVRRRDLWVNAAFAAASEWSAIRLDSDHLNAIEVVDALDIVAHKLQNQVKRGLFYRKPITEELLAELLVSLLKFIDATVIALGGEPAHVRATNINKLKLRYAKAYTDLAAIERNLAVEEQFLQSSFSDTHGNQ